MPFIKSIYAREVLDSRGYPTVAVEVCAQCGMAAGAIVPAGSSTGIYEAMDLRDMEEKRYLGQGVKKAVEHVNQTIAPQLCGMCIFDQVGIDQAMSLLDGTDNKGNLGANSILGVSLACAKTAAACLSMPLYRYVGGCFARRLPVPMITMISGGKHANNGLSFQEFMIMPAGTDCFREGVRVGAEVFHHLGRILDMEGYSTAVGAEGGYAPDISSNEKALALIIQAIVKAGYQPGKDVVLALDAAATEFWINGKYCLSQKENMSMTTGELIQYYHYLCDKFPIRAIEDGMDQDDWEGWCGLTVELGQKVSIIGDDFFVSSPSRIQMGVQKRAGTGVLIKPNQAGTLTQAMAAADFARNAGYEVIFSHRLGDSEDTTISDLAVALNTEKIKIGALCRAERTAKYNRLLKIEEELGETALYSH